MRKDPSLIISKKYAQAFLDLFIDQLSRDDIAIVERISIFLNDHQRILFFFKISVISDEKKRSLVSQWLTHEKAPQPLFTLIDLLINHKRLSLVGYVLQFIVALYKERKGIMGLVVTTSHYVSAEEKKVVQNFAAHQLPEKKLEYSYTIDPTLLLGIVLQSDTVRWETSLRKLLQEISHSSPGTRT